ncbi:hypothetical protein BC834DRAFT_973122 [Gloeopeniophorella convolvens]|nr:hypothetical protein BC834DRAFT_973122 [Gloeopeniophorella convolvens]
MPLFRRDSPYYTPLSGLIWISNLIAEGIPFFIFISFMRWLKAGSLGQGWVFDHWGPRIGSLWYGMLQAAENAALELPSDIDGRAIESLVRTLDEDHEMERLFAAIPGFLHSKVVDEPAEVLLEPRLKYALTYSITSFMERTLSSDLVSQDVKLRRGALCAKVLEVEPRLLTWAIQIYPFYRFLGWIDFGVLVSRQTGNPNKSVAYTAKDITATFTEAIGRTEERWFPIILRQMGVDEATLRQYISYGDSLSLANLLYRIRNALCYSSMDFPHRSPWPPSQEDARIRIEDTLPELQHQFCEVWNRSLDRITPSGDASTMRPWARFRWISILAYLHDFFETLHPNWHPPSLLFQETMDG